MSSPRRLLTECKLHATRDLCALLSCYIPTHNESPLSSGHERVGTDIMSHRDHVSAFQIPETCWAAVTVLFSYCTGIRDATGTTVWELAAAGLRPGSPGS